MQRLPEKRLPDLRMPVERQNVLLVNHKESHLESEKQFQVLLVRGFGLGDVRFKSGLLLAEVPQLNQNRVEHMAVQSIS